MMGKSRMHDPPHPGGVLKRLYLEPLELSGAAFARTIGVSAKQISLIVNGKARITPDLAVRIARALNDSPESWLNMQAQYDLWQAAHMEPHKEIKPLPGVRKRATA